MEWVCDSAFRFFPVEPDLELGWRLDLIERLPVTERGCLYLDAAGKPVCPDPAAPGFAQLTRHYGSVKGAWPRIVEESLGAA